MLLEIQAQSSCDLLRSQSWTVGAPGWSICLMTKAGSLSPWRPHALSLCTADPLKHYTGMALLVRPVRRRKIKPWRYLECSFCLETMAGNSGRGEVADRTTGKNGAGET